MYEILGVLSGNKKLMGDLAKIKDRIPGLKRYSLTLDNFFKVCLIVQRSISHIPIVIMGESGVGKTALITFLVELIFEETLLCYNIHAGINEEGIRSIVDEITEQANIAALESTGRSVKRVWVFFDEFNTTDEVSFIQEMVIDRRFMGS